MNIILEQIMEQLQGSINGIYATKENYREALSFAVGFIGSADPDNIDSSVHMGITVYHNTLTNDYGKMVGSMIAAHYPWLPERLPNGSHGEHEEFTYDQWVFEVSEGDTELGYFEWVNSELLADTGE